MKDKLLKIIRIWYMAYFGSFWCWYVIYPDKKRTRNLSYGEAKSLQQCFGGKLRIDYSKNPL